MQRKDLTPWESLDWLTIGLFMTLTIMGWFSIYSAIYTPDLDPSMFDIGGNRAGSQFLWIIIALVIGAAILLIDYRFWITVPSILYIVSIVLLIGVLIFGVEINRAKAWYEIGSMRLQPAEFAKVTTALYLAKFYDDRKITLGLNLNTYLIFGIIFVPAFLILLENETGSVLVFFSLIIVLYREGMNGLILVLGFVLIFLFIGTFTIGVLYLSIGLILAAFALLRIIPRNSKNIKLVGATLGVCFVVMFGAKFFVESVLQSHQRNRIYAWFEPDKYEKNEAYQTMQSFKAIGHGGFAGTGRLKGDLTQLEQVPEQFTDFIFCTIGEEKGWLGTTLVILIYVGLLVNIVFIAERQKARFARVYGYCVASILFFHFTINIGMTIGLFPVIGIPLPLFSYGGSSLWAFTIMITILLKFDMHRVEVLGRSRS